MQARQRLEGGGRWLRLAAHRHCGQPLLAAALVAALARVLPAGSRCLVSRRRRHQLRRAVCGRLGQRFSALAALLCELLNHSVPSGHGGQHQRALALRWRVGWVGGPQV